MPRWGQSCTRAPAPSLLASRHHACSRAKRLASVPPPFTFAPPHPSTHTLQSCWDKRVRPSQQPLSLAWDMSLASSPSPPLPVKRLSPGTPHTHTQHTHTHTRMHAQAHTCTHLSHTLSHRYTQPHTQANTAIPAASPTETPPRSERHPHMSMCTQRAWDGKGLMAWRDEAQAAGHMGPLDIDSQELQCLPPHTLTYIHTYTHMSPLRRAPCPLLPSCGDIHHTQPPQNLPPPARHRDAAKPPHGDKPSPPTGKCAPPPYLHLLTHTAPPNPPPKWRPPKQTHTEKHTF
uniref:Uncharacterized protein n=1 Tax=Mustela putorius furo TaxID=9669 RepID=M3Z457_MUSPF